MSRQCCGEAVASHDQAYQRSPLDPFPAERTSGYFRAASRLAAPAQVNFLPLGRVSRKFAGRAARRPGRGLRRSPAVRCSCRRPRRRRRNRTGCRPRAHWRRCRWPAGPWCGTQVQRQAHDQGPHRVLDVGGRNPLPGADQRVPGMLAHVGQVDGVDPVSHLARAAQVLPLHPGRGGAGLLLPSLIQRPDHQAALPPGPAGSLVQPGDREPPDHAHRRERVPRRTVEQPLRPIRRRSPACSAIVQPLRFGSPLPAHLRTCPPAATAPPGRNMASAGPAAPRASARPAAPLSWQPQPPPILLSSQTT